MLEKMLALQNKRKKEGGFTLVELIVVLVILAILAALLIPALTGYIDKAKDKNAIAETRQVVMAAQTIADESYAKTSGIAADDLTKTDVSKLAEVDASGDTIVVTKATGKIAYVKHKAKNNKIAYYTGSDYTTDETTHTTATTEIEFK